MAKTKVETQVTKRVFMYLSALAAVVFITIGGLALWAHTFIGDMVQSQLSAQKVYFPEKGSPALDPETYPDLQKYAGQLVDSPEKAEAYANGYIGRHLKTIANGKVYSEVSEEARKDPTNQTLQAQKATLFQGETLRGILLTSGYGFGTIGKIAGIVAYVLFAGALALVVVAFMLRKRK